MRGSIAGVKDMVPAYATVVLIFSLEGLRHSDAEASVAEAMSSLGSSTEHTPGRVVEIPVCYGGEFGPDLKDVAAARGLSPDRVVDVHAGAELAVRFLGFSPGFAYLSGLPEEIHCERLSRPRVRVPAGSVGIAGGQTGVYPSDSPGGWRLIGRTPLKMFDPSRDVPSLLSIGDRVRFVRISADEFDSIESRRGPIENTPQRDDCGDRAGGLRVIDGGLFTTIQDLGREGYGAIGVPPSGAADSISLRVGNRLIGNEDGMPALETTLRGGEYAFDVPTVIALTGADAECSMVRDGRATKLGMWSAIGMEAGDIVRIGNMRSGVRAYMCVAGGVNVPSVLGSASTHVPSGLGGYKGRVLRAGDSLAVTSHPWTVGGLLRRLDQEEIKILGSIIHRGSLRMIENEESNEFSPVERSWFYHSKFTVLDQSNRIGVRLNALPVSGEQSGDMARSSRGNMLSEAMPCGAVQIPPDGMPIILLADRPTTGGYPVMACVITADLPAAGQLAPRSTVSFERLSLDEAERSFRVQEERIDGIIPKVCERGASA